MPDKTIHRVLKLQTPHAHGADVKRLQAGINDVADAFPKCDLPKVHTDAKLGAHTIRAARCAADVLGLSPKAVHEIRDGKIDERAQKKIEDPSQRSDAEQRRSRRRADELRRQAHRHGRGVEAAVKWMLSKRGVHEQPAGSNLGPEITDWERETGYAVPDSSGHGVFWCGCFAHHGLVVVGKARIPDDDRLGYSGFIDADARGHRNGLEAISIGEIRRGSLLTFCFDGSGRSDHIATATGPVRDGLVPTIDGNSSTTNGSDNNGGVVAEHRRPVSQIVTAAKVDF